MSDKKTKEEIAYAILKHRLSHGDVRASELIFRNLDKASKETGIPLETLKRFARELADDFINEQLADTVEEKEKKR